MPLQSIKEASPARPGFRLGATSMGAMRPRAYGYQWKRSRDWSSLKNKVGHIMARASALRVNLNLQPSPPSLPRPSARTKHAHLLYALNLSHHILPPRAGA